MLSPLKGSHLAGLRKKLLSSLDCSTARGEQLFSRTDLEPLSSPFSKSRARKPPSALQPARDLSSAADSIP